MKSFKIVLALFMIVHHVNSQILNPGEIVHHVKSQILNPGENVNVRCELPFPPPGGDAPRMTLYSEPGQVGSATIVTGPVSNIATKTKSISGKGLWFLYLDADFKELFKVIASGIITKENLLPVHQDQLSSLRNAGSDDMSVEILTMYNEPDQCNASYIVVEDKDILLGFNDEASSFAITGNSAWTLYPETGYRGQATCIVPHVDHGFFYGHWNADDINIGDKEVSSVKKGCHSPIVHKFQPPGESQHDNVHLFEATLSPGESE